MKHRLIVIAISLCLIIGTVCSANIHERLSDDFSEFSKYGINEGYGKIQKKESVMPVFTITYTDYYGSQKTYTIASMTDTVVIPAFNRDDREVVIEVVYPDTTITSSNHYLNSLWSGTGIRSSGASTINNSIITTDYLSLEPFYTGDTYPAARSITFTPTGITSNKILLAKTVDLIFDAVVLSGMTVSNSQISINNHGWYNMDFSPVYSRIPEGCGSFSIELTTNASLLQQAFRNFTPEIFASNLYTMPSTWFETEYISSYTISVVDNAIRISYLMNIPSSVTHVYTNGWVNYAYISANNDNPFMALVYNTNDRNFPVIFADSSIYVPYMLNMIPVSQPLANIVYKDYDGTVLESFEANISDPTPSITTEPSRSGYVFTGWDPAITETVSGDVIYIAQYEREYLPVNIVEQGIARRGTNRQLYYIVLDYDKATYSNIHSDVLIKSSSSTTTVAFRLNERPFYPETDYHPNNVLVFYPVSGYIKVNSINTITNMASLSQIVCSDPTREVDVSSLKESYESQEIVEISTSDINAQGIVKNRTIRLANNVNDSVTEISAPRGMIWDDFFEDYSFPSIEGYECLGIATHPATIPMFGTVGYEVVYRPLTPPTE